MKKFVINEPKININGDNIKKKIVEIANAKDLFLNFII